MITAGTVGAKFAERSDSNLVMADDHVNRVIKAAIERHPDVYSVENSSWNGVYHVVADAEFFRTMPRSVHFYVVHQSGIPDSAQEWRSGAVQLRVFG